MADTPKQRGANDPVYVVVRETFIKGEPVETVIAKDGWFNHSGMAEMCAHNKPFLRGSTYQTHPVFPFAPAPEMDTKQHLLVATPHGTGKVYLPGIGDIETARAKYEGLYASGYAKYVESVRRDNIRRIDHAIANLMSLREVANDSAFRGLPEVTMPTFVEPLEYAEWKVAEHTARDDFEILTIFHAEKDL